MLIRSNFFLKYFSLIFFIIYFFIGLLIFKDYGITTDEEFQRFSGFYWLKYVLSFTTFDELKLLVDTKFNSISGFTLPNPTDFPFYGVVFDLPLAFLETVMQVNQSKNYFLLRHYFNFIIFFISSIYFFFILKNRFNNNLISNLGLMFYVGSPRIFGDSFFNNKDLVFLSLITIALFYCFKLLKNFNYKNIIIFSIFSAIATGSRIIGIFLPISVLTILFFDILDKKIEKKYIFKILILVISYFVLTVLLWPYLWSDPLSNFVKAFTIFSNYIIDIQFLFDGNFVSSKSLPYSYLPIWFSISTPIITQLLFVTGYLFYIKVFFNRLTNIEKSNYNNLWNDQYEKKDFFIFFNLTVILIYLIMSKAVLYNGWRQVYFLNVFIIYFASYGIKSLVENVTFVKKFSKYFYFLIAFSLILIFYSIYKYHPYQSLYFNNLSKNNAQTKFEVDYWGLSGKRFLNDIVQIKKNEKINIGVASWIPLERSLALFDKTLKDKINIVGQDYENADYIFSNNITEVNSTINKKYQIPKNFKKIGEFVIEKTLIYEVYKKEI